MPKPAPNIKPDIKPETKSAVSVAAGPAKTAPATIDGVACTLEKLTDGSIRVTHESQQVNAMHGKATAGEVMYVVHPAQRQHFELLNNLLPVEMRAVPNSTLENRPWWSYVPAAKENKVRGKDDADE